MSNNNIPRVVDYVREGESVRKSLAPQLYSAAMESIYLVDQRCVCVRTIGNRCPSKMPVDVSHLLPLSR